MLSKKLQNMCLSECSEFIEIGSLKYSQYIIEASKCRIGMQWFTCLLWSRAAWSSVKFSCMYDSDKVALLNLLRLTGFYYRNIFSLLMYILISTEVFFVNFIFLYHLNKYWFKIDIFYEGKFRFASAWSLQNKGTMGWRFSISSYY